MLHAVRNKEQVCYSLTYQESTTITQPQILSFSIRQSYFIPGPGDNREADEESISTITETETPSNHHKSG